MSEQLSILDQGERKFFTVSEHGIQFRPATPQGIWLETVQQLCGMYEGAALTKERTLMLLADALNHGEKEWPHEFAQAIDNTRQALGLSPKTIANAQWVYAKIPAEKRRDGLTLGHMSVIAGLAPGERDEFISEVIDNRMTVADLKEHIAEVHPKTKRGKDRKTKVTEAEETTESTFTRNLNGCANWISEHGLKAHNKEAAETIHKAYRRKWQSGRKKK